MPMNHVFHVLKFTPHIKGMKRKWSSMCIFLILAFLYFWKWIGIKINNFVFFFHFDGIIWFCDLPVTSQIALNIKTISRDEVKTLEHDVLSVFCILKFFLKSVNGNKKKIFFFLLIKNSIKLQKCINEQKEKFKLVQRFLPPDDDCFAYNLSRTFSHGLKRKKNLIKFGKRLQKFHKKYLHSF
jgi:hypothetical protein